MQSHLQILKEEYDRYFPDLGNVELADWKMTRNSFLINEDMLSNNLQEEFLEMKCNSTAKDNFEVISLNDFWEKYLPVYKNVGNMAICTFFRFHPHIYAKVDFQHL